MSIEIPEEYASADFGFSAVDEATFQANQKDAKETPPSIDENDVNRAILNALAPLEDKLDSLLTRKNAEDDDDVVYAKAQAVGPKAGPHHRRALGAHAQPQLLW